MQVRPLGGQPLRRHRGALPVNPGIHPLAPRVAVRLQPGEAGVLLAQVRLGRHQVRLGDLHRGFGAALGLRVEWPAGLHFAAVMAAQRHHARVADRYPGHMLDGHRLGVVGQQIRRRPADDPQRPVQARCQAAQALIPRREHHPEPRPGQPAAKQLRAPPADPRALPPVPLQPHPRFRYPRPVRPPAPGPPGGLQLGHRPPGRALRPAIAHRGQLAVHHIGADPAITAVDQLLHLGQERIYRPGTAPGFQRICPGITQRHITGHGLTVSPGQLRRRMRATAQVIRLKNFHDLPARLGHGPSGTVGEMSHLEPTHPGGTTHLRTRRSPGDLMTAHQEF